MELRQADLFALPFADTSFDHVFVCFVLEHLHRIRIEYACQQLRQAHAKVAQVAELPNRRVVKKAVAMLNERYEQMGCTFRIESIAGGYQMMSMPEYHEVVSRLFKAR